MINGVEIDTRRFKLKTQLISDAFEIQARASLTKAAQKIYLDTAANLKGPNYGVRTTSRGNQVPNRGLQTNAGTMPVPRVTGTLARSLKMQPLTAGVGFAIFTDPQIAKYSRWVHDGTKKMKPRRFLGDVVKKNRAILNKSIEKEILTAIRKVGRS